MALSKRPTELVDMAKLMSLQAADPVVLNQIAGPGGVRKVRVPPLGEVVIGRDDDCQIILDADPVSRRHAKILFLDQKPEIVDLGSTNGTFLNGKQILRAFLKDGDRIQVGGSIFQVAIGKEEIDPEPALDASVKRVQSLLQKSKEEPTLNPGQSSAVSGSLSEIRLPSLLQVIESDRVTGTLVIRHRGREGKLHLHQGIIRHATLGRAQGVKALYRLMVCDEGRFELFIPGRSPEYDTVEGDLQKHLLEAMRQKDEFAVYQKQLPEADVPLGFNSEMSVNVARVPAVVYEVLAAVAQHRTVDKIIEFCQLPDFEICRVLLVLLKHRLLLVDSGGSPAGKSRRITARYPAKTASATSEGFS
jgi:pSer/pThr/pTyr-binding forkhead associated (FHA) protein